MQEFDILFDYTFQEGPKLKLFKVNIIQIGHGISIDMTDDIIKNIIHNYWVTNTKDEIKFQKSPFTVGTYFEKVLFVVTPITGEQLTQIENSHGGSLNHWVGGFMYINDQNHYDFQ